MKKIFKQDGNTGLGRANIIKIIKITILLRAIHRFSALPVRLPMAFFTELDKKKKNLKFVEKRKRPQIARAILRKKNGAGGIRA